MRWSAAADQVELIDQTPEALRRRMAHGNIYAPEKVDAALANYFREGNLGALRELALMWVADRVDEALEEYRELHGISGTWETRERVVVAITGAPGGEDVLRRAARMAMRTRGELLGVHVRPADGLAGPSTERLAELRRLLTELGGRVPRDQRWRCGRGARRLRSRRERESAGPRREPSVSVERVRPRLRGQRHPACFGIDRRACDLHGGGTARPPAGDAPRRPAHAPLPSSPARGLAARGPRARCARRAPVGRSRGARALERAALVPVVGGGGRCDRRPASGAVRGAERIGARQLLLHPADPHVHDRGRREPARALGVPPGRQPRELAREHRKPSHGRCSTRPSRSRDARRAGRHVGHVGGPAAAAGRAAQGRVHGGCGRGAARRRRRRVDDRGGRG